MADYKPGERNAAGLFIADVIRAEEVLYILECPECKKLFIARRKALNQVERCRDCAQKRQKRQIRERKQRLQEEAAAEDSFIPVSKAGQEKAEEMPKPKAINMINDKPRHEADLIEFLDPRKMWARMRKEERESREAAKDREERIIELANGRNSR